MLYKTEKEKEPEKLDPPAKYNKFRPKEFNFSEEHDEPVAPI